MNNKPDFSSQTAEEKTPEAKKQWADNEVQRMRSLGAQHFQFTVQEEIPNLILMEGWKERPETFPEPFFHLTAKPTTTEPGEKP